MNEFLQILQERGYLKQATDLTSLDTLMRRQQIIAYTGFDCTAKSFHVGNLIQIMMIRILQQCGHKPIILLGGGTTKIGDPSDKATERKMISQQQIADNKQSLSKTFARFIDIGESGNQAILVDNSDWLNELHYLDFLSQYGRHFSINRMLTLESVKRRLDREQNLSFLEFNYLMLQAYDFVELYKRYGCRLQFGGSEQWSNIIAGIELARKVQQAELYGITSNLITTSLGAKMGKTVDGAIWLNKDMLSSYQYWQFWRNTEDSDVIKFLMMFTELPITEITKLSKLQGQEINDAKIILANKATELCHGKEAAQEAYQTAIKTFNDMESGDNLPVFAIDKSELLQGIAAYKLFAICGLCESGGAAKRLIIGGGGRVNNDVIDNPENQITVANMYNNQIKLSSGRKKHMIIKVL